jgi:hypothetical protein
VSVCRWFEYSRFLHRLNWLAIINNNFIVFGLCQQGIKLMITLTLYTPLSQFLYASYQRLSCGGEVNNWTERKSVGMDNELGYSYPRYNWKYCWKCRFQWLLLLNLHNEFISGVHGFDLLDRLFDFFEHLSALLFRISINFK